MPSEGRVFVIAEAGVNHDGDPASALDLIDVAADAGADAVKFQTFRADEVAAADTPKAGYQMRTTDPAESQLAMLKKLELTPEMHRPLIERCRTRGIEFMSTPFDAESLRFLVSDAGMTRIKVPSGEIVNGPLLLAAARTGKPIIVSTGMSALAEVADALAVLTWGATRPEAPASLAALRAAFDETGATPLAGRVTLLHCTSQYPAPAEDANLKAMATMRDAFGLPVGLSDHTLGTAVPVAAAALGATVIEKHFTLDRSAAGPDHAASLEPGELADMIRAIRTIEAAMGDGVKVPRPSELDTRDVARRSLVALRDIAAGETLDAGNVGARRPGAGASPMRTWEVVGRAAARDIAAGRPIAPEDFNLIEGTDA